MEDKDKNRVYYIPPNYQNRINLFGMITVPWANLIQGTLLGVIPEIIFIYFVTQVEWNNNYITIGIFIFAAGFIPGVVGIYNASLLSFLKIYNSFKKRKRLTVYNPRIKTEVIDKDYTGIEKQMLLPKDKIRLALEKARKGRISEENRRMQEQLDSFNVNESFFFEDDEGLVEKPLEYMTPKELKKHNRMIKKQEKEKMKREKKERKESKESRKSKK